MHTPNMTVMTVLISMLCWGALVVDGSSCQPGGCMSSCQLHHDPTIHVLCVSSDVRMRLWQLS